MSELWIMFFLYVISDNKKRINFGIYTFGSKNPPRVLGELLGGSARGRPEEFSSEDWVDMGRVGSIEIPDYVYHIHIVF